MTLHSRDGVSAPTATARRHGSRIALVLSWGALLVFVAGQVGGRLPELDSINQFAPAWPALALIGGAVAFAAGCGHRRAAASSSLAALACLASLVPPLLPHWPFPSADAVPIRIVAANVWKDNRSPGAAIRWILAQHADVVILLEAGERGRRIADGLSAALPYRVTCRGRQPCSTMVLARMPMAEAVGLARGDADNRRTVSAAAVRFGPAGGGFAVVGVHLDHAWPSGRQHRDVAELAARLPPAFRQRLVIAGDFNATPWTWTIAHLGDATGTRPLGGVAPSWPAPPGGLPMPASLPIDDVLLGPGWRAARSLRGPAIGSDHYPFLITLVPQGRP